MKKLLLICVALLLAGCVAVPAYDDGYYYPAYGPYPYDYWGPDVFIVSGFHGHRFHDRGFHRGGFHGGGFRGGSIRGGGFRGGGRR